MTLLSINELSIWVQEDLDAGDLFARRMIEAASDRVRAAAGQPDWTVATAPVRARQIASHLAARSYKNPDSAQYQGALGPIGGDRIVQELAASLHLTEAETLELERLGGAAGGTGTGNGLWYQPLDGGATLSSGDVFLTDDSGTDWMIPYLAEDDVQALG